MSHPSNHLQATRIFTDALELPPEERSRFLEQACGGNSDLREKVEALLDVYPQAESLFRQLGGAADSAAGEVGREEPTSDQTTEAQQTEATATNRIGRYRILEKIGEGGFGEVFIAQQTEPVKRQVALKILKAGMDTKSVLARFEAERQALAMMDHPNIAKVLDAGETDQGRPYFVMDLVEGEPITDYCDRHTLSTKERLELFVPVCRAVQHAHQKGIIHRDLKPSNILVMLTDGKPTPKVIDFGIAKATSASLTDKTLHTMQGQLIGTPAYMSPEQAEMGALDVDTRTDIYSLGVVLYELMAGSLPFDPESLQKAGFAEIQRILRQEDPPKPSTKVSTLGEHSTEVAKRRHTDVRSLRRQLRGELDWITLRAMEKDRTRRYETPNSLAMDIGRYLADEPVIAGPPSTVYRARKFAKRNKVAIGVAAVVLVAVTAWAVQSEIQKKKIEAAHDESEAVTEFLSEMLSSVDPAEQGKDVTVREIMDEAAKTIGEKFADQPLVEARLRHTMGKVYRVLDEYEASEEQLERAVEIRRRELGDENAETLRSIYSLAHTIGNEGRSAESETLLLQTLDRQRRILGAEHRETLETKSLLGLIYRDLVRYAEAESLLMQVLATQRRLFGDDDPATLDSMVGLASIYMKQLRYTEGESISELAVAGMRGAMGEEHPRTLVAMFRLALFYRLNLRYDQAESLLVRTLAAQRRVLGDEHSVTLSSLFELGIVHGNQGRAKEAESFLLPTLEARRRVLGEDHPTTLQTMGIVAALLRDQHRYKEAGSLAEQVLETNRRLRGDEHPETLGAMAGLAIIYQRQGRFEEAESLHVQVLEKQRRDLGEEHVYTLGTMIRLASFYKNQGRLEEAELLLLELLEPQRRALGEEDPGTLRSMNELAHLYDLQGRHEEAESLYRKTLEARQRVIGPTHRGTLWTMKLLTDLLRSMGREAEADSLTVERVARWKEAAESPNANAEAKTNYAWLLLTCELSDLQDPHEALRFAFAACEQTDFANPNLLDTLALAYHRTGQGAKAIETQKKAIGLLIEEAPNNSQLGEFKERLAEFEAAAQKVQ